MRVRARARLYSGSPRPERSSRARDDGPSYLRSSSQSGRIRPPFTRGLFMQDLIIFIQHHQALSLAFVILFILLAIVETIRFKRSAERVTPQQLTQLINHQNAVVVDLRPVEQFTKGHIIDALSLPLTELKEKAKKLDKLKARPLILVCAKGLDAPKLASSLKNQGFQVHILGGGMSSWTSADLPVVKE